MKHTFLILTITSIMLINSNAMARNTKLFFPIEDALIIPAAEKALTPKVALYFSGITPPEIIENLGEFTTNKKTNAVFKADLYPCRWAFLSALKTLQERAIKEGGNAVINIESYFKKKFYKSAYDYECHAGATIAGVTLRGTVIKTNEINGNWLYYKKVGPDVISKLLEKY